MTNAHITNSSVLGIALVIVMSVPASGNYSAPFKESALRGASVVLAKCSATDAGPTICIAESAIRGTTPSTPIQVPRYIWQRFRGIALDASSEATRFLLVLNHEGTLHCDFSDFIVLGDLNICVIPIIKNELPETFRYLYDRSADGALSLEAISSELSTATELEHSHDPAPRLDIEAIEEIVPVTSGFSIGCDWVPIEVVGRVLFRGASRKKQPLTDAQFWHLRHDQPDVRLDADVLQDGAYRVTMTVIDHYYTTTTRRGKVKEEYDPGSALLAVRAEGCEGKVFRVSAKTKRKKVVLKCADR